MDANDADYRIAFLEMTAADRSRLREIAPQLNANSEAFVEAFYGHLFAFEETARFLRDPKLVARLKRLQQEHLKSMLEDDVDDAYVDRRRRVGDVHAQVGISPQMFLGAYNQYLQVSVRQLAKNSATDRNELVEQSLSLLKAVFLDVELTLDAYFSQATRNLQKALDLVFQANTELRQFAQLASHDLKTPLATVANLCDEALDEFGEAMPAQAAELVEMAKQRTYRMSRMIDELLELSAPRGESQQATRVDMNQVVAEALERLSAEIARHAVVVDVPADLPVAWGNHVRLREAFFNVLSNAIKFMDKTPARVTITAESTDDACRYTIADNGSGIPATDLESIFSPFRRLRTHDDRPGSGLGLHFARALVEQDGGRIWATSMLGRGSEFHIQLRRRP